MLIQQPEKIAIFGHHHRIGGPCGLKDLMIGGVSVTEPLQRVGLDTKLFRHPRRQGGRELGVDPEDHAARTG